MRYARGKCLGSSSARNSMIYQRVTNASYQRWADLVGDESFRPYATYFERSIYSIPPNEELSFINSSPLYDASVMGDCQGPLSISYSNYAFSFASWATKGLRALGIQPIDGFLSGSLLGQSYLISTINATTMTRDSSETSTQRPRGGNGSGPSGRSARRRERQVPRRLPSPPTKAGYAPAWNAVPP